MVIGRNGKITRENKRTLLFCRLPFCLPWILLAFSFDRLSCDPFGQVLRQVSIFLQIDDDRLVLALCAKQNCLSLAFVGILLPPISSLVPLTLSVIPQLVCKDRFGKE